MVTETITLDIDGEQYEGRLAVIKRTTLGREDHGIPTAFLHCEGESFSQGAGGYSLDGPYMTAFVMGVLDTLGVESWEKLPGKHVMLLYQSNLNFLVVGIKKAVGGQPFLFKQALEAVEA
jgi:hypothetical protein